MEVFYFENVCEGVLNLPEDESKHISRVLRKNVGDCINITDGQGRIFLAEIISTGKHCSVNVKFKELQENKRNYRLHIAIAPTKMMERMEWMIEKTMEIGVDEITPILCEHSERKIIKEERLRNIAISAMKQSKNLHLPKINSLISFKEFIQSDIGGSKFIAYCENDNFKYFFDAAGEGNNTILIGPEGDFSREEVDIAFSKGFKGVSLGNTILRVETAAVAASMMMAIKNYKR